MKHLRKIVCLLICVVFFVALVIGLGRIFAIKNINVTLITYADDSTEGYRKAKDTLDGFKGESLLFFNEKDVIDTFSVQGSNYSVSSCEKLFPCTVNVVLKERHETFAVAVGELYAMYDSEGKFLRRWTENTNINDNSPNVEVAGVETEKMPEFAAIAATFKAEFKSLRSLVTRIRLESKPDVQGYADRLFFELRCGLKIQLDDYVNDTEAKIHAAYAKYVTLSDRQKLGGTIRSYKIGGQTDGDEGLINADYNAR